MLPHRASVMSSTRRTDTPARYISMRASSTLLSRGNPLEFGNLEGDISRSGGEISAIVAAAIALALLIAFIPGSLGQFLSLGLQQLVEGFLYAKRFVSGKTKNATF